MYDAEGNDLSTMAGIWTSASLSFFDIFFSFFFCSIKIRPELTRGDTQSMPKKGNGPTLRMARSPFSGNLEEKKYIYMNFIADVL